MKKILLPLILILCLVFNLNVLATPWDVSTANYANKYKDVSGQESWPYGLFFKSDGTKMYIVGVGTATVYQYSLLTAWDTSTATYESKYKDVSSQDGAPCGLFFTSDGLKMYVMGYDNVIVYQYSIPVDWAHKWNIQNITKWNMKGFIKWNDLE